MKHFVWLFFGAWALTAAIGCGRAAQIGDQPECMKAVDALYTALSVRDAKLLDQAETRLKELHTEKKLPDPVQEELGSIIAQARKGDWRPALENLSDFIKDQRR